MILFATSGGSPNRTRLYAIQPPKPAMRGEEDGAGERHLLFTAEHGGSLLSWDHSPTEQLSSRVGSL